jgi:expansin
VIKGRPWVTAGLISAATTVVIAGLIVVTQPRAGSSVPDGRPDDLPDEPSSLVLAASPPAPPSATGSATTPARSVTATATARASATTRRPRPKATLKPEPEPRATRTTRAAVTGPAGSGRIRYGRTYTGVATYYAATGAGNCSYEASGDLMVGAMNQADYQNSQACGAYLNVTGPNGTVRIRVVDRCPECPPGAIDLSRPAFAKIAPVAAGKVAISWRLQSPSGLGPVSYRYKSGSSRYWCAIQVRDHRNPVRSLQVKVGSSWKTLARQEYNYFVSESGSGCGGTIRITDIYGHRLTSTGIRVAPGTTQRGQAQFPAP